MALQANVFNYMSHDLSVSDRSDFLSYTKSIMPYCFKLHGLLLSIALVYLYQALPIHIKGTGCFFEAVLMCTHNLCFEQT